MLTADHEGLPVDVLVSTGVVQAIYASHEVAQCWKNSENVLAVNDPRISE